MHNTQARLVSFTSRAMALALMMGGGLWLQAQTAPSLATADNAPSLTLTVPQLDNQFSTSLADESAFSSSSSSLDAAPTQVAAIEPILALPALHAQYGGGRQRYGRPRYRGGNTNADGSPKYDFYVGGGFSMPIGTQSNYLTTGWGFQGGGGRMFNKLVGINLEFSYDHFGMTTATINQQSNYYFSDPTNSNGLGGNSHVWSFSLQPVVNLRSGEGLGAYVTGGVGFYHKVANFTLPQQQYYCDPYYGCESYYAPTNVDHYTSNAPGFDGGFGVTYKFSRFASERLYAEVRYVYVDNTFKPGITPANAATYTGNNYFPQNSQKTSYVPVKFGLRF